MPSGQIWPQVWVRTWPQALLLLARSCPQLAQSGQQSGCAPPSRLPPSSRQQLHARVFEAAFSDPSCRETFCADCLHSGNSLGRDQTAFHENLSRWPWTVNDGCRRDIHLHVRMAFCFVFLVPVVNFLATLTAPHRPLCIAASRPCSGYANKQKNRSGLLRAKIEG